jgi:ABC-type uncharacterized transport system involved in gliding motility auxiliary subunit
VEALMESSVRKLLIVLVGAVLLVAGLTFHAILLEAVWWNSALLIAGTLLLAWGAYTGRDDLRYLLRQRRGEIAVYSIGMIGLVCLVVMLSLHFRLRFDLSSEGRYSLSPQSIEILRRLEKPVKVTFFYDQNMRENKELLELYDDYSDKITLEFFDPTLNPGEALRRGVQFAGTTILESEGRKQIISGGEETDFTNGILRVSQGATQRVCFLTGHVEADPFSLESHDHVEGGAAGGHNHGLGAKLVVHESHGMGKARHALESINYAVDKLSLLQGNPVPRECSALIIAGPKIPLLAPEIKSVGDYLRGGGNALVMLDPYVHSGLEPLLRQEFGVTIDDNTLVDVASHYWSDLSSPAVTEYGRHRITDKLPLTFFPGARSISPAPERVPGVTGTPLVNSSKHSYGELNPHATAEFDAKKEVPGPLTIMAVVTKRHGMTDLRTATPSGDSPPAAAPPQAEPLMSRLVVVGDSDFATNSFFHSLGNGNLFLNAMSYLTSRENLIGIEPRTYDPPRLNLTNRQMKGTFFLAIFLVPALAGLLGFVVWWRQR